MSYADAGSACIEFQVTVLLDDLSAESTTAYSEEMTRRINDGELYDIVKSNYPDTFIYGSGNPGEGQIIDPTLLPTFSPTLLPTVSPTFVFINDQTFEPTLSPTLSPLGIEIGPTLSPTLSPSGTGLEPTFSPTLVPTLSQTFSP